jgi:hypothetical protein
MSSGAALRIAAAAALSHLFAAAKRDVLEIRLAAAFDFGIKSTLSGTGFVSLIRQLRTTAVVTAALGGRLRPLYKSERVPRPTEIHGQP